MIKKTFFYFITYDKCEQEVRLWLDSIIQQNFNYKWYFIWKMRQYDYQIDYYLLQHNNNNHHYE